VLTTLFAIGFSVGLTVAIQLIAGNAIRGIGLFIAILVPALVAPVFGGTTLVLYFRLEQAHQELRRLAVTDELTGAANRRHFLQQAGERLASSRTATHPMSVLLLDLDDFKRINDSHGHLVGDEVLRLLVRVCQSLCRREDLFARFGGEEFAYLLPDTSEAEAAGVAARVVEEVAGTPLAIGGCVIRVTVSIGGATLGPGDKGLTDLLARADQALYSAKRAGKNRAVAG